MSRHAWPPDLDEKIRAYWEQGLTYAQIARKVGRKGATVGARLRKMGLQRRANLTTGEIKAMQELRDRGWSVPRIARKTGRCASTVADHTQAPKPAPPPTPPAAPRPFPPDPELVAWIEPDPHDPKAAVRRAELARRANA